jgi:hypothetical protein
MILDIDRNVSLAAIKLLTDFVMLNLLSDNEKNYIEKYLWCEIPEIRNNIIDFVDIRTFNECLLNNNDSSQFKGLLFKLLNYIEENINNEYNKIK